VRRTAICLALQGKAHEGTWFSQPSLMYYSAVK
jgi:hypothetical protein